MQERIEQEPQIRPPMIGKLEFDLTDTEGQYQMELSLKASSLAMALWDIGVKLRSKTKYSTPEGLTNGSEDAIQWFRELYYEVLKDNGVEEYGY